MFKKGIAFITAVALVTSGIVFTPSNADAAVNSNQGSNSWKLVWSDESDCWSGTGYKCMEL